MKIIKFFFFLYLILSTEHLFADNHDFNKWLISFKAHALKQEISEITIDTVMKNVKFLSIIFINFLFEKYSSIPASTFFLDVLLLI